MANNSFGYGFYSEDINKPSILTASGPYTSIEEAISSILSEYQNISPITGAPPLGHKFGVKTGGIYTWYTYKSGAFNIGNVGIGIVPEGSGNNGIVIDVRKGAKSDDNNESLVDSGDNKAYIPMATNTVDGLLSSEDKKKLDKLTSTFIEVVEPGIYNVDANFEVEPVAASSTTGGDLEDKVNKIIGILGSLYSDNATFIVE